MAEYAPTNKLYFLGGYELRREEQTKRFIQETERLNLPLDFHIYCKDDRAEKAFGHNGIRYLDRSSILSFEENLSQVQSCVRSSILHNSNITAYHSVSSMRCVR